MSSGGQPGVRDLLTQRAEMAKRLRANLMDQSLRSSIRERCGSTPCTPGRRAHALSAPTADTVGSPAWSSGGGSSGATASSFPFGSSSRGGRSRVATHPAKGGQGSSSAPSAPSQRLHERGTLDTGLGVGREPQRRVRSRENVGRRACSAGALEATPTRAPSRTVTAIPANSSGPARSGARSTSGNRTAGTKTVVRSNSAAGTGEGGQSSGSGSGGAKTTRSNDGSESGGTRRAWLSANATPIALRGRGGADGGGGSGSSVASPPVEATHSNNNAREGSTGGSSTAPPSATASPTRSDGAKAEVFDSAAAKAALRAAAGSHGNAWAVKVTPPSPNLDEKVKHVKQDDDKVKHDLHLKHDSQAKHPRSTYLEAERRRLLESSISAFGGSSSLVGSETYTPPMTGSTGAAYRASSPSTTAARSGGLGDTSMEENSPRGESVERPEWLLADGRLLTACLEGENRALRRAVARAKNEIDVLVSKRQEAELRSTALKNENEAATEALRRWSAGCSPEDSPTTTPTGTLPGFGGADACDAGGDLAAACLRRLVGLNPGAEAASTSTGVTPAAASTGSKDDGTSSPASTSSGRKAAAAKALRGFHTVNAEGVALARERLLQTSEDVGKRMEEILARRGKLQVAFEPEAEVTDTGSSAPSGECSTESSGLAQNSPSLSGICT
eukprot:TRINITY_DN33613_c0_g1_i1.p1 TRINITY_DN33613_c0_g1~~TRINITY_DN33613_c0_g1_i1.p1  ORF type:complete len:711 (+),score=117.53 TRINITY_DN33613_c0_g1_i1:112-2133(+)